MSALPSLPSGRKKHAPAKRGALVQKDASVALNLNLPDISVRCEKQTE